MSDKTKIPELDVADIGEMHMVAMYAWQSDVPSAQANPAHIVALADEVLSSRKRIAEFRQEVVAHRSSEVNRCLRLLRIHGIESARLEADLLNGVDVREEALNLADGP